MRKLTQEEYKKTIIEILFKIDEICRSNNLQYMIFYGTLLGAVRHGGMIPWDDIDIVMPRKDYTQLSNIINNGDYHINFIDIDHNPDTIFSYGKVCDKRTVMYEKNFVHVEGYGAFVDVFPLDYAPNDERIRLREKMHLRRMGLLRTHAARTGFEKNKSFLVNVERWLAFVGSRVISPQYLTRKINNYVIKRDKTPTDYYRVLGGGVFPVEWLHKTSEIIFEGRKLLAPLDPDTVLQACFGNYMELPPVEQRVNKHTLECYFID